MNVRLCPGSCDSNTTLHCVRRMQPPSWLPTTTISRPFGPRCSSRGTTSGRLCLEQTGRVRAAATHRSMTGGGGGGACEGYISIANFKFR